MTERLLVTDFVTSSDGQQVQKLAQAGLLWLEKHYEAVNRLNVFPVPDGDTGTNMLLTMQAACAALAEDASDTHAGRVLGRLAHGALHGSRGNSGTALSQLLLGLAQATASSPTIDARLLAAAFRRAVEMAYQTFERPVEGTILTVAREIADEVQVAVDSGEADLRALLRRAVERGKQAVARTPEMMPLLKKAGVVDSGGQGLVILLDGALRWSQGLALSNGNGHSSYSLDAPLAPLSEEALDDVYALAEEHDAEGFGFDVQFMINGQGLDPEQIRRAIRAMGHSAIVVGDPTLVKVHVHVPDPNVPLRYGRGLGRLTDIVIENMQEQAQQYRALRTGRPVSAGPGAPSKLSESDGPAILRGEVDGALNGPQREIGVIAVAPGAGLRHIFLDLGVARVVSGGQTMNPSTGELIDAIDSLPQDKIILLPNNRNVILTARQAARLAMSNNPRREVRVVPTRAIPQGIAAALSYLGGDDLSAVADGMQAAADLVQTGEITTATRALEIDGLRVAEGQWIGLLDETLRVAGDDLYDVLTGLLDQATAPSGDSVSLVSLYYGEPVAQAEAEMLAARLAHRYADLTFELRWGGQPHYPFILGIE